MKKILGFVFCVSLMISASAFAGKTYQVTGPIVSITDTTIVVKKGKDNWEIDRTPTTKIKGELKVGSKVTVYYSMSATDIEGK